MIIYLIVFSITIIFAYIAERTKNKELLIILACLSPILLAGVRDYGVGTDSNNYIIPFFNQMKDISSNELLDNLEEKNDIGYLILAWLSTIFSNNPRCFLFFSHIWIILILCFGLSRINKQTHLNYVVLTFILLFYQYNYSLNYIRQFCAISAIIMAYNYTMKEKWIYYVIWQLIAYSFHSTAAIGILLPVFKKFSTVKNRKIRNWLIISVLILLISLQVAMDYFFQQITTMSFINEAYQSRYEGGSIYTDNAGLSKIGIIIAIYYGYIGYLAKKKSIITNDNFSFFIFLWLTYFCIFLLSSQNMIMFRLSLYFFSILTIQISHFFYYHQLNKIIKYGIIFIFIFNWFYDFIIKGSCQTYPYASSILGL